MVHFRFGRIRLSDTYESALTHMYPAKVDHLLLTIIFYDCFH